jgi:diguanylate cyclase (GGDEF)-like protein
VSPILTSILTALGGVLAGFACAGALLYWQQQQLNLARRYAAVAEELAARAEQLASRDDTTGLPNRRAFLAELQEALAAGAATGVVLLDLDDFKTVNDTFGHECGNDLLTAVGLRLADLPTPVRLVARLSGDEFALLIDGDTDQTLRSARAAWQVITVRPLPVTDRHEIPVRVSVGYATATAHRSARDLLHQADLAMYHAKRAGTGVYHPSAAENTTAPPHTRCRDLPRRD